MCGTHTLLHTKGRKEPIVYRCLKETEVERFWELMNELDHETSFMMYEPGERRRNIGALSEALDGVFRGKDFLLIAETDGALVGYIRAERGACRRIRHSAYVVAGIRKEYCNRGIGTEFFQRLDCWAKEQGLRRLELTVMCSNNRGKHVYEKNGFSVEGIKKDSMLVDGKFVDEYYMAKLL